MTGRSTLAIHRRAKNYPPEPDALKPFGRELGILFTGELALANMRGHKSQTRRQRNLIEINKRPDDFEVARTAVEGGAKKTLLVVFRDRYNRRETTVKFPFGGIGAGFYQKEPYRVVGGDDAKVTVVFRADYPQVWPDNLPKYPWKPAMYMRKAYSRFHGEITGIRIERLQAISEEDARDEGVEPSGGSYRAGFEALWGRIYDTATSWKRNPWVWVLEYKKREEEE
jgi:hypothetical protein